MSSGHDLTYIKQFEAELVEKLGSTDDTLESYRNGITAGQKGVQVIRKGQSRRRGLPSQAPESRA